MNAPHQSDGPPYLPKTAGAGGEPTVNVDVPVLAVLILIYLAGAMSNMTIFQLNRRKRHRFFMSWALFGFCMARVGTCVLRLAWATRPTNARLAIATLIFTNAGTLALYFVIMLLAQRIFRATYPRVGWNRLFSRMFTVFYVLLVSALVAVIAFTLLSLYTLNTTLRTVALWVQRGAITYLLIFNVVSALLLLVSLKQNQARDCENFGTGSIRSKQIILGAAVFFSNFIAGFRCGIAWAAARPASDPAWYDSKPAFYVILFGSEIVIIFMLLFTRFDRRFWIPNGSKKPGDYHQMVDYTHFFSAKAQGYVEMP